MKLKKSKINLKQYNIDFEKGRSYEKESIRLIIKEALNRVRWVHIPLAYKISITKILSDIYKQF